MKAIWLSFILLGLSTWGYPAGERMPVGGRSLAMGGASVVQCDLWSLSNNQAGAAWLKGVSLGAGFENRFLLKELMTGQFAVAVSWKAGTAGILVTRFGNSLYNETKAGLTFARKFGNHFSAGVQVHLFRIHLAGEYGNKNLVSCEIGLMYRADRRLSVGVQLLNPVPQKISDSPKELLPSILCAGIGYHFSEVFSGCVEVEKDLEHPLILRTGAECHFARPVYARIGFSTSPCAFSFGFGLEFGKLTIDVASGYHQALGFSPSGAITFTF